MGANKLSLITGFIFFLLVNLSYSAICSYGGPDTSNHAIRLENLTITGSKTPEVGSSITVEYIMTNAGKQDVTIGKDGLHSVAENPKGYAERFGRTSSGLLWKSGKTISYKESYSFDQPGEWVIWPSYHLTMQKTDYYGPDDWHSCKIYVNELAKSDSDGDGVPDDQDNCPSDSNQDQLNSDQDSHGDACDNCPLVMNEDQIDSDNDGIGDSCDDCDSGDDDGDNIINCNDDCVDEPETWNNFQDDDGCPDNEPVQDEQPKEESGSGPKINISPYPSNASKGDVVRFKADAEDDDGIDRIVLLINGNKAKECRNMVSCSVDASFEKAIKEIDFSVIATDERGTMAVEGSILDILFGESASSCQDSDHGNNPFRMGFVQNETPWTDDDGVIHLPPAFFDECIDGGAIREYFCNGSAIVSAVHECNGICYDAPSMVLPSGASIPTNGDACVCEESDYGLDKFQFGFSGADPRMEDYCIGADQVMEYYCDSNELMNRSFYCNDGCIDGRCRCEDSDGGKDYYEKGWWIEDGGRYDPDIYDYCDPDDDHILHEFFPKMTWYDNKCEVVKEEYECPGLCIDGECALPSCEDGILNQDEEDIDCGGPNCPVCETCSDMIWNQDEDGVDCGGSCPDECSPCTPILINSMRHDDAIDVVFVMDEDYAGHRSIFLNDVMGLIENGYFGNDLLNTSRLLWNFYAVEGEGDYEETCSVFDVPDEVNEHCSFRDSVAIVHRDPERDCASGNVFSTEWNGNKVVVHESGHALFGLADEYCCDGGYWQDDNRPNIFESQSECERYADSIGEPRRKCFKFCPDEKFWPGTTSAVFDCETFFTIKGWDLAGCNCTSWASAKGLDPAECEPADPDDAPGMWKGTWFNRGVTITDLTVKSPMWCNYRGWGYTNCCEQEWWKIDADENNHENPGSCIMKSGNQFDISCQIRVQHKLDEFFDRRRS